MSQREDAAAIFARLDAGEVVEGEAVSGALGLDDEFGVGFLGVRWGSLSRERVTAHLTLTDRHHQPYGIVHGGVWCSIVETLASVAAWLRVGSRGQIVVGVSNTTDFLRAHRTGVVDAVAEPVHVGRTQQLWVVQVRRREDGKTVARGQVRLQNVDSELFRSSAV